MVVNNNNSSGIGFFGLLTVVLIALKLTGYIKEWWYCAIPLIVLICLILLLVLGIGVFEYRSTIKTKKKLKKYKNGDIK